MKADLTGKWSGAAALAVCALLPVAGAAETIPSGLPPAGCETILTVQANSCLTTRVWTCPGDPAGQRWYGVQIGGVDVEVNRVDAGFNAVETHYIEDAATVVQTAVADPVDIRALAKTGTDAFDYVRRGDDGRADERYLGQMALMGRIEAFGDEAMHMVHVTYEVFRGDASIWTGSAVQYLSPDETMLFHGKDYDAEGAELTDYRPQVLLAAGAPVPVRECEG